MATNKEVLTTFEAAEFCNTSYMSVKRWIWSGKLEAFKTPGGHFRIRKSDLIDFMQKNGIPVPEDVPVVRKKVLIVDDDELVREGVANFLRMNSSDMEVATAEDGYEAGILVSNYKPDIVILDLMMPKMDGFAVCEKLRKSPMTRKIRIIVMTGYGSEENVQRALACGADQVLSKPVEMEELYDHIRSLM